MDRSKCGKKIEKTKELNLFFRLLDYPFSDEKKTTNKLTVGVD